MKAQQTQFALSLLAYAAQRHVSPAKLCAVSNIDYGSLKKNDGYSVSNNQLDDLWFHSSQLSNDPLFGLHFGESLQLAALGVVGEIVKSSRTVGEALRMAASLTPLVTDMFTMEVSQGAKTFAIRLIQNRPASDFVVRQMADLLMVFTVHELDGLLLEKIKPVVVQYPYPVSPPEEYARVLRCPITKSKRHLTLQFHNRYWEEPILTSNYDLQSFLLDKVQALKRNESPKVFNKKVFQFMLTHAYLGVPSLEDVAANFNITPRNLQRRLRADGVSFQQLSNELRKSLALQYLKAGNYPMKEISHMLGYNELSAFSRAFKRWTGKAPAQYFPAHD